MLDQLISSPHIIFVVIFGGLGIFSIILGILHFYKIYRIKKIGIKTTATIIGAKPSKTSIWGNSYNKITIYQPIVEFTTQTGEKIKVTYKTAVQASAIPSKGSKVNIYYMPDNPENILIDKFWLAYGFGISALVAGLFLCFAMVGLFLFPVTN